MSENSMLQEIPETPESVFGPPRIDFVGVGLMALLAIFCGLITSITVFISSFVTTGRFSLDSGVSSMILAMISFFALIFASYVYIWGTSTIFPGIYSRMKTLFAHATVYLIILYICMMPVYILVNSFSFETTNILMVYLIHILLASFGLELVMALVSQYRYVLLSFYANLVGLVFSGGIIYFILHETTKSKTAMIILMALPLLAFTISTLFVYLVRAMYSFYYQSTGNDPLWNVFAEIEKEEREKMANAEKVLFQ